jgi:hypothetical protein
MNFPSPYNTIFPNTTPPLFSPTPPPNPPAPAAYTPPFSIQPAAPFFQSAAANGPNITQSFQQPINFASIDCAIFPPTNLPPKPNNSFGAKPGAFFAVFNGNKQA